MSFLDEQKRAETNAELLLEIIENPERFSELFALYRENDGLVDAGFIDLVNTARQVWRATPDAEAIGKLPLAFREALFIGLQKQGNADLLKACLERATEKAEKKRLKRLLYELKQGGIEPQKAKKKGSLFNPKLAQQADQSPLPQYVSPADGRNERIIIINEPARGKVRTMHIYERGGDQIVHYFYDETSRKKVRQFVDKMIGVQNVPLVEISQEFAYYLAAKVLDRMSRTEHNPPTGFVSAASRLSLPEKPASTHPYRELVRGDAVLAGSEILESSTRLHQLDLFRFYMIDEPAFQEFQLGLQELTTSQLILEERQKAERLTALIDRIVDKYFDEIKREQYADRLQDCAYLLAKNENLLEAETAAALAFHLQQPDRKPSEVPFFREMLLKTLEPDTRRMSETQIEADEGPKLIL